MSELKRRMIQLLIIMKYFMTLCFVKLFFVKEKNVWLISERGDEARDNGYFFYKYLKEKHHEVNVKFIITKKSADYKKIDKNDVIYYRSFKHILYFLTSRYLISTHIQGTSPEFRSFMKLDKIGIVNPKGKQIMLQHGITKDIVNIMLKKNNPNLNLMICGALPEYEFISKEYGYLDSEVVYTGFARFDSLKSRTSNNILLMPTWRDYLFKSSEKEFEKSNYFKHYNELLNSQEIINILNNNNLNLIFYPHYEVQKYINKFTKSSDRIVIADFEHYDVQKLLIESKVLITDYSSVYFDFSYMRKPVIYYHFDYDEYRKTQYAAGYFDYKTMGFGKICTNQNQIVEELKKIIQNNFEMEDIFLKRMSSFYVYNDSNNCERIFNEIKKL